METKDQPLNKFRVLLDFERGTTSLSQAANLLDARCASDVMKSLVAYREHLVYLVEASERLALQYEDQGGRKEVIDEVAKKLGISGRQVNRMMKSTNVITPSPYREMMRDLNHEEAKEKWRVRFRCALSVIAGYDTMESTAEIAEVTSRQMYRWVNKLLATQELPLKDLKRMTLGQRKAIADTIETTQGAYFEHDVNGK